MAATVFLSAPEAQLFTNMFPLSSRPTFLPPPPASATGLTAPPPFAIPDRLYHAVLNPVVPITIAALYTLAAKSLNAYNKSTGKRPWGLSRTRSFAAFVIAHNVFLAVYSAWTWWGMLGALRRGVASPLGPDGLSGFVDSMCRLHGPAGLGNAVYYSDGAGSGAWSTHAGSAAVLGADGAPSRLEPGRIWNEGLAFYGWIFYLSKFYEVLDTFIILAKGKLSSTLQTYHHAGAMMCMWAGMRYMSPPIWMFAFVNSGIHAMMYTYYTITAFNIRVPMLVKRSLTSLQITQFVIGASYAMMHSFVSYTVPVPVATTQAPVSFDHGLSSTGPIGLFDTLKSLVLGAAGYVPPAAPASPSPAAITTTMEPHVIPCITGTTATFAIWLNVLYLAPLTYLFASFFVASYLRRSSAEKKKQLGAAGYVSHSAGAEVVDDAGRVQDLAEKAGWDAARRVEREMYGQGSDESDVPAAGAKENANLGGSAAAGASPRAGGRGKSNGRALRSRVA